MWMALGRHGDSELLKTFCYDTHDGGHSCHLEGLQLLALLELFIMVYAMVCDHGLSLICMSASNFSHFRHLHQNRNHDDRHGYHLESLQLLSAPEPCRMELIVDGRHPGKASGRHGDLELLKWFHSDIQEGLHGSHLENLQITSAPER